MGYLTDFFGRFELDRPLTPEHAAYLRKFAETRRMKRYETITASRPDPTREAAGLPVGIDGGYFVGGEGPFGQENWPDRETGVLEYNQPPAGQPGLWCQWTPTEDRCGIEWDGGEKFYRYVEWLQYICDHFLKPWGYSLRGEIHWQGESPGDRGTIYALGNRVATNLSALERLAQAADE